jgi:hypothetical protein
MKIVNGAFFLFLCGFFAANAVAQSKCCRNAHNWIDDLQSPKENILQKHSDSSCSFAAEWVAKIDNVTESEKRERTCTDLVLLWAHKDCVYFRDVIDSDAYYPCKAWTREMFRQCMSANTEWFLDNAGDG